MSRSEPIGVVGAGSWGTALAWVLGQQGIPVRLWGRNREQIEQMARERVNRRYMPDTVLPNSVQPTAAIETLQDCPLLVLAVPSGAIREVAPRLPHHEQLWIIAAKGLEPDTGKRLSEVAQEATGISLEQLVVLSGPNLAAELVRGI
ncbi:MAG: NAD(P)-binding domain-containing protein, partial [Fimbriimonadales bacterium]|nr:NAD(P)-binding domain-containing protein [Fimbriimonadales bacterium]